MSDSPFADAAVFVVGSYRSGTTWLARMLAVHDRVTVFPGEESNVFTALAGVWRSHEQSGRARDEEVVAALRRYCDRVFLVARGDHDGFILDKTPAHVHRLPLIGRVYPDAWVVHIVRDGRDVARSLREYEHGPDTLAAAAEWARAVAAARADGPALDRFREVRYETLLADPATGVADLLAWMGLPVDDELKAAIGAQAAVRVSQHNTTGEVGAGKWQALTPAELAEIESVAGDELRRLGYT